MIDRHDPSAEVAEFISGILSGEISDERFARAIHRLWPNATADDFHRAGDILVAMAELCEAEAASSDGRHALSGGVQ